MSEWHLRFHGGLYDGLVATFGIDNPPRELIFREVDLHHFCVEFVYRQRLTLSIGLERLRDSILHYDLVPSSEMVRSYNVAQKYIRYLQDELDRLKRTAGH